MRNPRSSNPYMHAGRETSLADRQSNQPISRSDSIDAREQGTAQWGMQLVRNKRNTSPKDLDRRMRFGLG